MAIQSRSRAPRNSGSHTAGRASTSHASNHHASSDRRIIPNSDDNPSSPLPHHPEPPAKRRKLSIRSKQTTLDSWTSSQSAPPKPPTRVTVTQPHGRLLQNLNGVQTLLDAEEDELSLPTSGITTPKLQRLPKTTLHPYSPPQPAKQDDKRSLRSHDEGPRVKSELAIYFPNYEEIIFDAPHEPDFITVDSNLYVTDDVTKPKSEHSTPTKAGKNSRASPSHSRKTSANGTHATSTASRSPSNQFNGSPSLNFEMFARNVPDHPEDPLADEHFLKSHRRAERKEKQLRNIEKERAMHEKVQLDRILEGLKGHDWLKVLGITGVTDGEAKKYEPKRDYFVAEVQALVDKFKLWKEQERKQRVEKESVIIMREAESEEPESGESSRRASEQRPQCFGGETTTTRDRHRPEVSSYQQRQGVSHNFPQQAIRGTLGPSAARRAHHQLLRETASSRRRTRQGQTR